MVEERIYRRNVSSGLLHAYEVKLAQTDLFVSTDDNLYDITLNLVVKYRNYIENYIKEVPSFLTSLLPLEDDPFAPKMIRDMLFYSKTAGVGPMAAVAGAMAQYVGTDLGRFSRNVIIENGGDNYLNVQREVLVCIHAGKSPLSDKVILRIEPEKMPLGVCTSSGTIGHSLSFGRSDAVCVLADSAVLADAAATALGNQVKDKRSIEKVLERGKAMAGIRGIVIILGETIGAWGDVVLA